MKMKGVKKDEHFAYPDNDTIITIFSSRSGFVVAIWSGGCELISHHIYHLTINKYIVL